MMTERPEATTTKKQTGRGEDIDTHSSQSTTSEDKKASKKVPSSSEKAKESKPLAPKERAAPQMSQEPDQKEKQKQAADWKPPFMPQSEPAPKSSPPKSASSEREETQARTGPTEDSSS